MGQLPQRFSHQRVERPRRADGQSLCSRPQSDRVQLGLGGRSVRVAVRSVDRHGDAGVYSNAVFAGGAGIRQADVWTGQSLRNHPSLVDARYRGTDGADGPRRGLTTTVLSAEADPEDAATLDHGAPRSVNYSANLDTNGLRGARIGLSYLDVDRYKGLRELLQGAEAALKDLGAVVERVDYQIDAALWPMLDEVLNVELKERMGEYLRTRRPDSRLQSLRDLIEFNKQNADREMRWFGQDNWVLAETSTPGPAYTKALLGMRDLIRRRTLDPLFVDRKLNAVAGLAFPLPWKLDPLQPDFSMEWTNVAASSAAGYPSVTVPMGSVSGLPVGMVLFGRMWNEAALLTYAYAYEQATRHRKAPTYPDGVDPLDFRVESR